MLGHRFIERAPVRVRDRGPTVHHELPGPSWPLWLSPSNPGRFNKSGFANTESFGSAIRPRSVSTARSE